MKIERWIDSEDLAFVALGVAIGAVAILAFQTSSSCRVETRERAAAAAPAFMSFPFTPNDEALSWRRVVIVEGARAETCRDLSTPECRATASPGNPIERTNSPHDAFSLRLEAPDKITPPDAQIPKDE
jgi:hypothetical protein